MHKDTVQKLRYYAEYLEGVKTSIQKLESQILQTLKEEELKQAQLYPEFETDNTWNPQK